MMLTPFFKVVDGTSYCSDTPDSLVQVLERARLSRLRVRVTYGEGDSHDGYVGRTTGPCKVPILVHNSRSLGGEPITERCVLEVRAVVGRALLWKRA